MKGFAILCVVLGHVLNGYLNGNTYVEANGVMFGLFRLTYSFQTLPLFMLLSGYVYCIAYPMERHSEKRTKLYRQTGNNIMVYILFSIGLGLLKIMFARYTNQTTGFGDLLMIWCKPIAPYWYLYDLIIFYLVFSWRLLRRIQPPYMLGVLLALSFASSWMTIDAFGLSYLLFYAVFFYMGMVLRERPEGFARGGKGTICVTFFLALALSVLLWFRGYSTEEAGNPVMNGIPIINTLAGMSMSLTLWQIFQNRRLEKRSRLLQAIGRYSLEIYVIHCVLTAGFRTILPRIGVTNALLSVGLNFTLSMTLPILFAVCTKKLKIHDLFFRPVTFFTACRK